MSFGYEIQEEGEDHFIQIQEHLLNQINEFTAPGAFMVDLFPFRTLPPPVSLVLEVNYYHGWLQFDTCLRGCLVQGFNERRKNGR